VITKKYWFLFLIPTISLLLTTTYVYADVFSDIEVTGVSIFRNDLIFDRTDNDNSIVQGQNAFDNNRGLIYQKVGGGPMSEYRVLAAKTSFTGGPVGIGTLNPTATLDINGILKINNDIIVDRTDNNNSIVQGQNAFDNNRHITYQKLGGGPMSGYIVSANFIALNDGNVGIGTNSPAEALDVVGNIRLTGNIVSPGDICIGLCS